MEKQYATKESLTKWAKKLKQPTFNITKVNSTYYTVETDYNKYDILMSETTTVIYLKCEACSVEQKVYRKQNLKTAINYLLKKELFIN